MLEIDPLKCECCGGQIDRITMKCPYCGTAYARKSEYINVIVDRQGVHRLRCQTNVPDEIAEALNLGKSHGERTQTFADPVSYARHGTVTFKVDEEKEALRAKAELLQNMYNDLLGKVIAKLGV